MYMAPIKLPASVLFSATLIMGTIISITSTSWFGAWMGLEINLLSFIPLMTNTKNIMSTEASLKYFLVQALASAMLLFSIILTFSLSFYFPSIDPAKYFQYLIISPLLLKMGAAPFHFWFPGVMEGLSWKNCFILMTWQKIAPLMLLSYVIKMNIFIGMIILLSVVIGSLGGLNQSSLRKLMAYSSINHVGWMIAAMIVGDNMWELYFLVYSFLSFSILLVFNTHHIFHINQNFLTMTNNKITKSCVFLLLLSLGGLPPFFGFFPKWLIIQALAGMNYQFIVVTMVIMTLVTLFYYLRLTFHAFLFSHTELKTTPPDNSDSPYFPLILALVGMSTFGLPFSSLIYSML
uniref:NADH-ubiquinone oxidoreductase chain 2 n=1 Tax=Chizuella bonneti TaxID=420882 RepID=A0A1Q1MPE2_9ORTH|nr:NADH dehydrogenase subunit 2 [Metrioptera bonneti]AQM39954.1 NADH dehydrogenase subunit 2 [Metrioptera bonneti]